MPAVRPGTLHPVRSPRCPRRERGSSLILATALVLVVAGTVAASTQRLRALDRLTSVEFSAEGQARSLAQAGLVDAFAWFRRQTTQPVAAFAPVLDLAASPPINETDDPSVGLEREFELTAGIWGRYTVRRGTPPETYDDANANGHWDAGEGFVDTDGDGRWTPGKGTRDVTSERGLGGVGAVWRIESRGEVFRRSRADLALGEGPNVRLGMVRLATEVRRLTIVPPAEAAICARDADLVEVRNRGRIRSTSGSTKVGVASGAGTVVKRSGGEILASIASTTVPNYRDQAHDVFGVTWSELKAMSDITTKDATTLPAPLPKFSIVTVEGDALFDPSRPLRGTALLAVKGNLTVAAGSTSFFNGVLYVDGDIVLKAPVYLRGTIIATGHVTLVGSGDYTEVEHDAGIVSRLLQIAGQYRYSTAVHGPARLLEDGSPRSSMTPVGLERLRAAAAAGVQDDDAGGITQN
ncbi:MAG: hypothetical protein ACC662_09025 [Planctomycetota bacterium]